MAIREIRPIRVEGNIAFVPLTQGYEAIIDASDVPLVAGRNWYARVDRRRDGSIRCVYAVTSDPRSGNKKPTLSMHRVIDGTPSGFEADHRDGDGLNNRKGNLRSSTKSQNRRNQRRHGGNTSGFKGVSRLDGKWRAQIRICGQRLHLGTFDSIEEAAEAYAAASSKYHGDFGRIA